MTSKRTRKLNKRAIRKAKRAARKSSPPTKTSNPDSSAFLNYRSCRVAPDTINEESRTVDAVIATENRVSMPDWSRMEMVDEVLLMRGVSWPSNEQMPFLDSHRRHSIKDQVGSIRNMRVDGDKLIGTLHFSRSQLGADALNDVRDGHLTDISVGYEITKQEYVPEGETVTIEGRSFDGPANIAVQWKASEGSATPIGADDQAKMRGADFATFDESPTGKDETMNKQLRALLELRGMPVGLSDADAQAWLADNQERMLRNVDDDGGDDDDGDENEDEDEDDEGNDETALRSMIAREIRAADKEQRKQRAAFITDVNQLCELAELPDEAATCRDLEDLPAVRAHLVKAKAERDDEIPYRPARQTGAGIERLARDITGVLTMKAARSAVAHDAKKLDVYFPEKQRTAEVLQLEHATLLDLAGEYVRQSGMPTLGLTRNQIAICAMFGPDVANIRQRAGAAYHNTGSFANLTLDAINKSMQIGYTEVPATWRGPMRQGESVADFKQINRTRLGDIQNLPVWNDTQDPERASIADANEPYAVEARSIGIDFGYKLITNDDMSALTRTPQSLGDASARTVNAVAWSQWTSNPLMSDGVAVFSAVSGNRKRSNLTTGAAVPTTATNGAMRAKMRQMRGENTPEGDESDAILNLAPTYLIAPSTLEETVLKLIGSDYDPDAGIHGVHNTSRQLMPVIEPILDADSATAWYLSASPTRIDTCEVTFLQGQETPQVREVVDPHRLAMTYYVLQSVGAKFLNHRGVQRHNGA